MLLRMTPAPVTSLDPQKLKAIADETRLRVLALLGDGECCVCELTEALDIAQPLLSFHLKVLKAVGLVTDRREGRWAYYALNQSLIKELGEGVSGLSRTRPSRSRRRRVCT
jgi:ArsR family transcriptional regulator